MGDDDSPYLTDWTYHQPTGLVAARIETGQGRDCDAPDRLGSTAARVAPRHRGTHGET